MEEAEDESCLWVWRPAVGEGHVIVTEGHQYALLWGNRSGAVALNGWRGVGLGRGPRGKAGAVLILDMNSNWAPGAQ